MVQIDLSCVEKYCKNTNTNNVISIAPFTPEATNGALHLERLMSTPC